eukprot:TRINITY_DN170_c0_g1_i17.p1 TRINITY_DN170_c0_g1~~TRINITY_DN170_c0_g1_i17.p1  ORF type:complete len:610 (+),score=162.59 TRINITY_DN170_c0_g1_i17:215-1831(+)
MPLHTPVTGAPTVLASHSWEWQQGVQPCPSCTATSHWESVRPINASDLATSAREEDSSLSPDGQVLDADTHLTAVPLPVLAAHEWEWSRPVEAASVTCDTPALVPVHASPADSVTASPVASPTAHGVVPQATPLAVLEAHSWEWCNPEGECGDLTARVSDTQQPDLSTDTTCLDEVPAVRGVVPDLGVAAHQAMTRQQVLDAAHFSTDSLHSSDVAGEPISTSVPVYTPLVVSEWESVRPINASDLATSARECGVVSVDEPCVATPPLGKTATPESMHSQSVDTTHPDTALFEQEWHTAQPAEATSAAQPSVLSTSTGISDVCVPTNEAPMAPEVSHPDPATAPVLLEVEWVWSRPAEQHNPAVASEDVSLHQQHSTAQQPASQEETTADPLRDIDEDSSLSPDGQVLDADTHLTAVPLPVLAAHEWESARPINASDLATSARECSADAIPSQTADAVTMLSTATGISDAHVPTNEAPMAPEVSHPDPATAPVLLEVEWVWSRPAEQPAREAETAQETASAAGDFGVVQQPGASHQRF